MQFPPYFASKENKVIDYLKPSFKCCFAKYNIFYIGDNNNKERTAVQ